MKLGDMYPAVLTLVLVSILLGVGLTVLGNLATSTGITPEASLAINNSILAIDDFVPWFTVLVVIIAAAIIIGMVIRSFSGGGR